MPASVHRLLEDPIVNLLYCTSAYVIAAFAVGLLAVSTLASGSTDATAAKNAAHARSIAQVNALDQVSATNGILTVIMDSSTGRFTIQTGASHPQPNETVFYPV